MTFRERTVRRSDPDRDVVHETNEVVTRDGIVTNEPVVTRRPVVGTTDEVVSETVVTPSGGELARRFVVLIFGIIQVLIALRIALLLLAANADNGLVSFIYQASDLFVAPFNGIFGTDALKAGGSVLDIAAIAALVGWTILEAIVLWIVNLFRREPTV